jgi:hypothetical protein
MVAAACQEFTLPGKEALYEEIIWSPFLRARIASGAGASAGAFGSLSSVTTANPDGSHAQTIWLPAS